MSEPTTPLAVGSSDGLGLEPKRAKCVQDCGPVRCKNMKCTYDGMDGERYRCDVCGESYFLDYEEMR